MEGEGGQFLGIPGEAEGLMQVQRSIRAGEASRGALGEVKYPGINLGGWALPSWQRRGGVLGREEGPAEEEGTYFHLS